MLDSSLTTAKTFGQEGTYQLVGKKIGYDALPQEIAKQVEKHRRLDHGNLRTREVKCVRVQEGGPGYDIYVTNREPSPLEDHCQYDGEAITGELANDLQRKLSGREPPPRKIRVIRKSWGNDPHDRWDVYLKR